MADEYDAAQDRGEVATVGQPSIVPSGNDKPATAAEIGISVKYIHEARMMRDAEEASPGGNRSSNDAVVHQKISLPL